MRRSTQVLKNYWNKREKESTDTLMVKWSLLIGKLEK